MRKPVGVMLAAVTLGLIALLGAAIAGLALGVTLYSHRPLIPRIPAVEAGMYLMAGFCLFCLWTAIGLIRMRRWTRPAMVVVGGVIFVFSTLAGGGLMWVRQSGWVDLIASMAPPGPYSAGVRAAVLGAAVTSFLVALAGVWWMVYFCRERVKGAFSAGVAPVETAASGGRNGR
jgi:hypothetical protein